MVKKKAGTKADEKIEEEEAAQVDESEEAKEAAQPEEKADVSEPPQAAVAVEAQATEAGEQTQAPERQIGIHKIYVKDFSFESPRSPEVFTASDWQPQTSLNLRSTHTQIQPDNHEIVLTITVETKHEEKTLFLAELQQAGIFLITGYEGDELGAVVGSFCPNVLYPYARECIASMISRGGFPEFLLQPINFDALYAQSRQQAAMEAAAAAAATPTGPDGNNGGGAH
jgi:preprotein translocase subunit SecB